LRLTAAWNLKKIAKYYRCILRPAGGVPVGIGFQRLGSKTGMMELPDSQKSFSV